MTCFHVRTGQVRPGQAGQGLFRNAATYGSDTECSIECQVELCIATYVLDEQAETTTCGGRFDVSISWSVLIYGLGTGYWLLNPGGMSLRTHVHTYAVIRRVIKCVFVGTTYVACFERRTFITICRQGYIRNLKQNCADHEFVLNLLYVDSVCVYVSNYVVI